MAVDFSILARVPTIGSQIMAGQEAGREAAARNMLLQQRQLEFQQAQEDRQRRLREERIFEDAAQMIRQSGLDPEDPKVLQQFTAAAVQSRNPQLMSLATTMSERMAKRRQERADAAAVAAIAARRRGEAPAGAPAPAEAAPMLEAPAAVAAPVLEAPPPQVSPVARAQAEQPRPYFYGQGTFAGTEPTAMAAPVGAKIEPVRTDLPAQDMYADLAAANKLAPPAPVVNRMMAAPAPAPAVQVAGPAAMPAAPKVDIGQLQTQLDTLQEDYDDYIALGTEAGRKAAAALKPQMGRLERQIRDANKATERQSPLMRDVVAFGFEPTADGLAKFEAAKRDPDTVGTKEYNLAVKQGFKGSLFDYKKQLAEATRSTVEFKLPPQEGAFETGLGRGQSERILKDQEVAQDARSIIDTVQQGRQLLQSGMITGFGAEALTQIGAALNQAGISFASDSVANTQAFAANMAQNVGRIIKQFGAGTGLSNADREYAEKMAGGKITLDRKAIERILDINERAARNVITAHNKRVAGIKTNVPLTVELPPAMPTAPAATPAGRPSLQQIFQQPAGR